MYSEAWNDSQSGWVAKERVMTQGGRMRLWWERDCGGDPEYPIVEGPQDVLGQRITVRLVRCSHKAAEMNELKHPLSSLLSHLLTVQG